jgi:tape measure domain-containing protein
MAAVTTELKVLVKAVGKGEVDKLSKSLNDLGSKAAAPANRQFRELSLELKKIQRNSTQSIANLRGYRNAWRDISEQVKIGSREFKVATENAKRLDAQLQKAQGRPGGRSGQRLRSAAQIAGTIAGAGVFGGFEGAAGAGIGALFGGAQGAIVGAGIGAQVGAVRQALGGIAAYGAELNKLRIALRGVTESQAEYEQTLGIIKQATQDFAIPQSVLTRQFTRLQASVAGAGGSVGDTEKAFKGIVAAVRATGGSLQDVDSALTATAQVFSKGKVSAEELRQQIGERLPGAFTIFAKSIGLTPQELDKALEDGKVSLSDFLIFAEDLFDRYYDTSQRIAGGPEAAGDRLKVALEELNEDIAPEMTKLGAQFQTFATEAVKALQGVFNLMGEVGRSLEERIQGGTMIELQRKALAETARALVRTDLTPFQREFLEDEYKRLSGIISRYDFIGPPAPTSTGILPPDRDEPDADPRSKGAKPLDTSQRMVDLQGRLGAALQAQNFELVAQTQYLIRNEGIAIRFEEGRITAKKQQELLAKSLNKLIVDGNRLREKAKNGEIVFNEELTKTEQLTKNIAVAFRDNMAQGISDVILKARSLGDVLSNVLKMAANLFIQFGVKTLLSTIPGFDKITGSANGNVFYQNKVVPFARGGIVNQPTIFPLANGAGVMGEQGPEAIMPLRRGPSGRLGVEAAGGAGGNVVVNVDASGSAVQGDSNQAAQLGKAIGSAVQAELIKQKRPGGLLAGV